MEHKTPNGIAQGYFCMRCGKTTNMLGSGHGENKCDSNPELVAQLVKLNSPTKDDK